MSCFDYIWPILRVTCSPFLPTAPSPPRMLIVIGSTTSSTVELNWLPPLHPNGAVHYEIEYEPAMTPGDPVNAGNSSSPYFTLALPNEFLTYNVRVAAVNTQGQAQSSVLPVCLGKNREGGQHMIMTQCLIMHHTVHITSNLREFVEIRGIPLQIIVNCCAACRVTSVPCPQNVGRLLSNAVPLR